MAGSGKLVKGAFISFEKIATPDISDQNDAFEILARFSDQIHESFEQAYRQIINTVIAFIFQCSDCSGFSRTGHAGDDDNTHGLLYLIPEGAGFDTRQEAFLKITGGVIAHSFEQIVPGGYLNN